MAKNATYSGDFAQKKGISVMALRFNESVSKMFDAAGNYLVGVLPPNALVTDAYMFTAAASQPAVAALGTTEGGAELLSACDTTTLGKSGVFGAPVHTGSGMEVFLSIDEAVESGEFVLVIEYLEYTKNTGEYTLLVD